LNNIRKKRALAETHAVDIIKQSLNLLAAHPNETRSVQILRPFAVISKNSYSSPMTPPIGPAYLASILESAGYKSNVIDGVGEDLMKIRRSNCGRFNLQGLSEGEIISRIDPSAKILGISMMFSQEWVLHRQLIKAIKTKFPKIIIVAGGEHVTALPQFILRDCPEINYIISGEGELSLLNLVHHLFYNGDLTTISGLAYLDENKRFINSSSAKRFSNIDSIPWPSWDKIPIRNYFIDNWTMGIAKGRNMPIVATRGCPYQCTFCSNPTMWTTRYVLRTPSDVVDEIQSLVNVYNANNIDFYDLTAIVKKDWILEFCQILKQRDLNIEWQLPSGTRSEALDLESLTAIKQAGCAYLVYAPESGSKRTLVSIKKKIDLGRMIESIKLAKSCNITVKINLIMGFPDETIGDIMQTYLFALKMAVIGVDDCNISLFACYPGSELFDQLRTKQSDDIYLNDDYFNGLIAQFDMTSSVTFAENIPKSFLVFLRLMGHLSFYLLTYILHPTRIFSAIRSILTDKFKPANLFEQRIFDLIARLKTKKN
jgi:anaerobic magnesium-protoporphyrin IX monomethyl ester cyclase